MWPRTVRKLSLQERLNRRLVGNAYIWGMAFLLVLNVSQPIDLVAALQGDLGFSPASGHAQVIAQGVVELPRGKAAWRTVRARAPLPSQATFASQPLGFVFASSGPMLLVDGMTGEQVQLGTGEGALVRAGTLQQRSSLADEPVTYLAVELGRADAPTVEGTVLKTGEPFVIPGGLHDVDLLTDSLATGESLTIPDSGAESLLLVTAGAAAVTSPDGDTQVLLAGESVTYTGEYLVSPAPDSDTPVSVLAALIGPEMPSPILPAETVTASPLPAATDVAVAAPETGEGSITIQVYACPAGMTAQRIEIMACSPISDGFDIAISGPGLAQPLALTDAATTPDGFTWQHLPLGDYVIAETRLPSGATSYVLAARDASGSRVSIDTERPDQSARIYNFSP